jgi:hypothetical protein
MRALTDEEFGCKACAKSAAKEVELSHQICVGQKKLTPSRKGAKKARQPNFAKFWTTDPAAEYSGVMNTPGEQMKETKRQFQFGLRQLFLVVALAAGISFIGFLWIQGNRMVLRVEQEYIFHRIQEGRMTRDQAPDWFTDQDYERLARELE